MNYLIIDDEHELYRRMFADMFKTDRYDIEEVPRMVIPRILKPLYKLHHSDRINRRTFLPFKMVWKNCYRLHKYPFRDDEKYTVIFLNGSLRYNFSQRYLTDIKKHHPNVRLCLILYDSYSNPFAKRSISMVPLFDYVFSFDEEDCKKHGFERVYSTFSMPDNVKRDEKKSSKAFFIGFGAGRLKMLQRTFKKIIKEIDGCRFYIAGVKENDKLKIPGVIYNVTMPYSEELQMAYNTECIVEVVKEGQSGVSLRTCEAIAFNKKLLSNNQKLKEMPFYDERYMRVFKDPGEIDIDFLTKEMDVSYERNDYFSPVRIIERIDEIENMRD